MKSNLKEPLAVPKWQKILIHIHLNDNILNSMSSLVKANLATYSHIVKILYELEDRGVLTLINKNNKRSKVVKLTAKGIEISSKLHQAMVTTGTNYQPEPIRRL